MTSDSQQIKFHAAEIAVQEKTGVAELVAKYGNNFIRNNMPEQHRNFFRQLPFVILGIVDKQGYPWVMPLSGSIGFITSPDNETLIVNNLPKLMNALDLDLSQGQKIGLLGIDLLTRRRNRVNGVIKMIDKSNKNFSIHVEQSFGNCPQYIQMRELSWQENNATSFNNKENLFSSTISIAAKKLIKKADTFFIASRTQDFNQDSSTGIDASHRGGKPGFVKVEKNLISFPDFSGNRFFNTLGNIESDGRVGLFFPDFNSGETVFIIGKAKIAWDHENLKQFEGAERIVQVESERVVHLPHFLEMKGNLIEASSSLKTTGTWQQIKR